MAFKELLDVGGKIVGTVAAPFISKKGTPPKFPMGGLGFSEPGEMERHFGLMTGQMSPYEDLMPGTKIDAYTMPQFDTDEQQRLALRQLRRRAMGQTSRVGDMMAEQMARQQGAAMGQAASARGAYDPSMAAFAQRQASAVPMQMAAPTEALKAQERLEAMQAYQQASAAARGQEAGEMGNWLQLQEQERQRLMENEAMRQRHRRMIDERRQAKYRGRASVIGKETAEPW